MVRSSSGPRAGRGSRRRGAPTPARTIVRASPPASTASRQDTRLLGASATASDLRCQGPLHDPTRRVALWRARDRRRVRPGGFGPRHLPQRRGPLRGHHGQVVPGLPAPARTGTDRCIVGSGFDRDDLEKAGALDADALAAVTSGDNTNILTVRIARETYMIPNVVARIYDPRRAEIYQRLGIPTVATVTWTIDQVRRRLLPDEDVGDWSDPTGRLTPGRPLAARCLGRPAAVRPGGARATQPGRGDPGRRAPARRAASWSARRATSCTWRCSTTRCASSTRQLARDAGRAEQRP